MVKGRDGSLASRAANSLAGKAWQDELPTPALTLRLLNIATDPGLQLLAFPPAGFSGGSPEPLPGFGRLIASASTSPRDFLFLLLGARVLFPQCFAVACRPALSLAPRRTGRTVCHCSFRRGAWNALGHECPTKEALVPAASSHDSGQGTLNGWLELVHLTPSYGKFGSSAEGSWLPEGLRLVLHGWHSNRCALSRSLAWVHCCIAPCRASVQGVMDIPSSSCRAWVRTTYTRCRCVAS